MKFFWLLMAVTVAALIWQTFYSGSMVFVAAMLLFDCMALWASFESKKGKTNSNPIIQKMENLEKLTSDMFEKLGSKLSHEKKDKKEIVEWLDRF